MRAMRSWRCAALPALLVAGLWINTASGIAAGEDDEPAAAPAELAFRAALARTKADGTLTAVVCTARDQPSSVSLWTQLRDGAWARHNQGVVQLVEFSSDRDGALMRALGVKRFPTVVVYGAG